MQEGGKAGADGQGGVRWAFQVMEGPVKYSSKGTAGQWQELQAQRMGRKGSVPGTYCGEAQSSPFQLNESGRSHLLYYLHQRSGSSYVKPSAHIK